MQILRSNKLQQAHKNRGTALAALRQYAISTGRHNLVPSLFSLHPLIQTQGRDVTLQCRQHASLREQTVKSTVLSD